MGEYNPELLLKYDPVRAAEDKNGFVGEIDKMKRSDHVKAVPKLYAVAFNYVDVKMLFKKPFETETRYGKRWIYKFVFVNADPNKMALSVISEDGTYRTSWFAPTFKYTKCNACTKSYPGKHIDKCDCGATNVYKGEDCFLEKEFLKVMNAAGYDQERWEEFTFRLTVSLNKKNYPKYTLNVLSAPKDATPRTGMSLLGGDKKAQDEHWDAALKEKLEATLVPVVIGMNAKGNMILLEDWIATLITPDFGVETEEEATRLWDYRQELVGWPNGV
jgi:hypothetical protein